MRHTPRDGSLAQGHRMDPQERGSLVQRKHVVVIHRSLALWDKRVGSPMTEASDRVERHALDRDLFWAALGMLT